MPSGQVSRPGMKGFTLIELLVVVAIIALLISILLPSLGKAKKQAQAVACAAHVDQVYKALFMYIDDHKGDFPNSHNETNGTVGSLWSESAWNVAKRDLWFYKLFPNYLGDGNALRCAGDPFGQNFDFEARNPNDPTDTRRDTTKPSCGYGANYIFRHAPANSSGKINLSQKGPKRPSETIMLAEVGPDDVLVTTTLFGGAPGELSNARAPWRDGGALIWDIGNRSWVPTTPSWLTARHVGSINMLTVGGDARRVSTVKALREGPKQRTTRCHGRHFVGGRVTFVCAMCEANWSEGHYQFVEQKLWWWTGRFANDPLYGKD